MLHKKGEREDIGNWRPLRLLNTDYKIIAKTIANDVIHTDPKGFIPGRSISDSNRLIHDIISYTELDDLEGCIIFQDQQKAFDRVEWRWVNLFLHQFSFGDEFIKWIHNLL